MLGPHASFIIASFALVGAVVLALIVWVMIDHNRLTHTLRDLEAKGLTRRSARGSGKTP